MREKILQFGIWNSITMYNSSEQEQIYLGFLRSIVKQSGGVVQLSERDLANQEAEKLLIEKGPGGSVVLRLESEGTHASKGSA